MADMTISAIGLLGLINTVVEVINLGYAATGSKKNIKSLAFLLNVQSYMLTIWAENIGITGDNDTRKLDKKTFIRVQEILEKILSLFDQSKEYTTKYDDNKSLEPIPKLKRMSTAMSVLNKLPDHKTAQSTGRAIKWALRDKTKFEKLVVEIQWLMSRLQEILPLDQEILNRQTTTAVVGPADQDDLDVLGDVNFGQEVITMSAFKSTTAFVSDAARLRAALPIWGVNQRIYQTRLEQPPVNAPKFASRFPSSLNRWSTKARNNDNDPWNDVLVEWRWDRDFENASNDELKLFRQDVARLVKLLLMASNWPQYHLIDCLGFFIDNEYQRGQNGPRYGILYRLPEGRTFQSLRDAMRNADKRLPWKSRLHIAKELVTAACYFLSIGWLHKAINSINVILLQSLDKPLSEIKLIGFQFARPDQPAQRSLDVAEDQLLDLYRHKGCKSAIRQTSAYQAHGYRKIFDIYSVGVLLVEIGRWQIISDVETKNYKRWKNAASQDFDSFLVEPDFLDEVTEKSNNTYANLIKICLKGEFGVDGDDETSLPKRFDELVVRPMLEM